MQSFDLEALVRAFIIGISIAVISGYIVHRVTRSKTPGGEAKGLLTLALIGVFLLASMGAYYAWPSLPTVPLLEKLSQADAERILLSRKLVPQPRPQLSADVPAGRVVPHSQDPGPGLTVHPGTVVSFGVSVSQQISTAHDGNGNGPLAASLFQPKTGESLHCAPDGSGIYHCKVSGTSSGVAAGRFHLLLWVEPVSPPSDQFGWYLQRSGNGINQIGADGSWVGVIQLGNAQYPPHAGDLVDIAVSVVDDAVFHELIGREGVVVEAQPVGTKVDIASHVVITPN